jgi:hypothetical protein
VGAGPNRGAGIGEIEVGTATIHGKSRTIYLRADFFLGLNKQMRSLQQSAVDDMRGPVNSFGPKAAIIVLLAWATSLANLDHGKIHSLYNDGQFEKVISEIHAFTTANPTYSREDSIFIAKHYSVVYSSNPSTREKGMYYMHQLLALTPSADLVDMFVGSEIDRLFEKVQKEFQARHRASTLEAAPPESAPPPKADNGKPALWKRKGFWLAAGTGLVIVGATVAALVLLNEEKKDPVPEPI